MKAIPFYLFIAFTWLITLLPLPVLYLFSYPLFFLLYYFPGYRKDIVLNNLANAFPEKTVKERKEICRKYYWHLSDLFIEGIKLRHMSYRNLSKHFRFVNPELVNSYHHAGYDIIATLGHYGNWEWIVGIQRVLNHRVLTVYKPLHNKYFDNYFKKLRGRFGIDLVPMNSILRKIIDKREKGIPTLTALVSDQTPPRSGIQYWTKFLNQDTPVYLGVEKIATRFSMVVLFFRVTKVKRGYYELVAEVVDDNPNALGKHELTEKHIRILEQHILNNPEFWLWSHRRWKHKKPVEE